MDSLFLVSIDYSVSDYIESNTTYIRAGNGPRQIRHMCNGVLLDISDVPAFIKDNVNQISEASGDFAPCLDALRDSLDSLLKDVCSHNYHESESLNCKIGSDKAAISIIVQLTTAAITEEKPYTHSVAIQYTDSDEEDYMELTDDELSEGHVVAEFITDVMNERGLMDKIIPSFDLYLNLIMNLFAHPKTRGVPSSYTIALTDKREIHIYLAPIEPTSVKIDGQCPKEGDIVH